MIKYLGDRELFEDFFKKHPAPDIDLDAAKILNASCRTVDAILKKRRELDLAGKADVPLVVIAGESHSIPAHKIHHLAVVDGLSKREPTAFAFEMPHNIVSAQYAESEGKDPSPAASAWLKEHDKAGELSLKTALGFYGSESSEHARVTLFKYLLSHAVPTRLTDAVPTGFLLDLDDPSTAASLPAEFNRVAKYIAIQPDGVRIRNHHMAKLAAELARESHARILVHQCGIAHGAGDRQLDFAGGHSLAAYFSALNLPVLLTPIEHKSWTADDIPAGHGLAAKDIYIVTGLPEAEARPLSAPETLRGDPRPALAWQDDEADYVNGILRRIGLPGDRLTMEDYWEQRLSSELEMRKLFISLKL